MNSLLPALLAIIFLAIIVLMATVFFGNKGSRGKGKKKAVRYKDKSLVLKEATRRLAQNPRDIEALSSLGDVYFSEQSWDKAFKIYETMLEAGAGNPDLDEFESNRRYGLSAVKLGRFEEAYKGFAVAHAIKQDDFETNYNLGYLEFQKRAYEKAIFLLRIAAQKNPEHALTQRYLGHALFKTKNSRESLAALKKALDLQPDDKESLFLMGECFYELGQLEQAIRVFLHLRTDPVLGPNAALFAGTIHLNQRQTEKAIMDFEIGLKHPDIKIEVLVEIKYRLASAYLKDQEISRAVAIFNEIQGIYPSYKDVPVQLAKYRELNSNRNLQIYLMAPASDFVTLCRKLVLCFFPKGKIKITDITVNKNDWADILAEVETSKWSDVVLFRFIRSTGTIGELALRDFHARIKDLKAGKGYFIAAGTFSDEAKRFVEARLIDLLEKPKLMSLLNSIESSQKGVLIQE